MSWMPLLGLNTNLIIVIRLLKAYNFLRFIGMTLRLLTYLLGVDSRFKVRIRYQRGGTDTLAHLSPRKGNVEANSRYEATWCGVRYGTLGSDRGGGTINWYPIDLRYSLR